MSSDKRAQAFIEALENLIIPMITSKCSPSGLNTNMQGIRSRSGLAPEALKFITALNEFVTALIKASAPQPVSTVVPIRLPITKPPRLQLALETMHHRVFNRMPIRLLTFDSNGSGIGLIERGQLWQNISFAMEIDYDDNMIEKDIARIKYEQTHVGQTANSNSTNQAFLGFPETLAMNNWLERYSQYAILSHTWLQGANGEVTYNKWQNGNFNKDSPGYQKLVNFCHVAATGFNVTLGWMDTICIDKESSSELDESIRSMYRWYQQSHACITYLADTTTLEEMHEDKWFTRGWTLQELIAPATIKFYDSQWRPFVTGTGNDKTNDTILNAIHQATGIKKEELDRRKPFSIPISRRMQWAAARKVTREEDASYSLMGIFGVSFSVAYGEGAENAFSRLAQAILNSNTPDLLDITNWGAGREYSKASCLLPRSVRQYAKRTHSHWCSLAKPAILTHLGLQVSVLLMPAIQTESRTPKASNAIGDYYATIVDVEHLSANNRVQRKNWSVLDRSIFTSLQGYEGVAQMNVLVLGVLNFLERPDSISISSMSRVPAFAIPFELFPGTILGVPPEDALYTRKTVQGASIVFNLMSEANYNRLVFKGDLHKHGITLRTMYL